MHMGDSIIKLIKVIYRKWVIPKLDFELVQIYAYRISLHCAMLEIPQISRDDKSIVGFGDLGQHFY